MASAIAGLRERQAESSLTGDVGAPSSASSRGHEGYAQTVGQDGAMAHRRHLPDPAALRPWVEPLRRVSEWLCRGAELSFRVPRAGQAGTLRDAGELIALAPRCVVPPPAPREWPRTRHHDPALRSGSTIVMRARCHHGVMAATSRAGRVRGCILDSACR